MTPCRVSAFDVQTCPVPASSDEFLRVWKRQCITCESRVEFLRKCGAVKLQSLFKVNLPGELLSDILIALESMPCLAAETLQAEKSSQGCAASQQGLGEADGMHAGNAQLAYDILKAISGELCRQLCNKLASVLPC